MAEQDFDRDAGTVRINGTLDAAALYIEQTLGFSADGAAKTAAFLWLEQTCELAGDAKASEPSFDLTSLADFGDEQTKAQGMVANSRIFLNFNAAAAQAVQSIPAEVLEDLLIKSGRPVIFIKTALHMLRTLAQNAKQVGDGLACVCMRAWQHVNGQTHVPFQVSDIMPGREFPRDADSSRICELTQEDGRQRLSRARWECPWHEGENYCTLTSEKAGEMLDVLVQQHILESVGGGSYAFL